MNGNRGARTENPDGADHHRPVKEARRDEQPSGKAESRIDGKKKEYLMRDVSRKRRTRFLLVEKEPLSSCKMVFEGQGLFAAGSVIAKLV